MNRSDRHRSVKAQTTVVDNIQHLVYEVSKAAKDKIQASAYYMHEPALDESRPEMRSPQICKMTLLP